jgi:Predicted solute binding protein
LKKISSTILALLMMIGVFGLFSNSVARAATPEVVTVNIADLTKEQREAIQPGQPTPAKEGERTLLVYAYDKNGCQLAPALPETGTGSQALMMVAGILALTGAAYFLVSNKNGKKIVLMAGLVLSGAVAVTSVVSANETVSDDSCYKYVGFLREFGETTTVSTTSTEATTEVTTAESTEATTTTEETTESTTESTTTTTTTEEPTTEAPTTGTTSSAPQVVAPNDHL